MNSATLLFFLAGLGLLILGAELLVRGASRLAAAAGITPLIVGLTVVAYGTSAPEMAVSVGSALRGQPDLALGNVVGSNIFNVLFILGVSAVITPLLVQRRVVQIDVPVMLGVALLPLVMGRDGLISRLEGALLAVGAIAYTVWLIREGRRDARAVADAEREHASHAAAEVAPRGSGIAVQVLLIVAGLALLVLGARWLLDGAVAIARWAGLSELVIGLTIVAAGTSMPEVAASVAAALKGERDIAVGNVVGSNVFNILAVLGVAAALSPAGIAVAPSALAFDIPVMIAVAVACLPIFFTGHLIARWEGLLFLAYYAAYTAYLVLAAAEHDHLATFGTVMGWIVLPLTALTLAVLAVRALPARGRRPGRP